MEYNFKSKRVLVTGSGRGIGQGIASSLAAAGTNVYALDCDKENVDTLAKEIPSITAICHRLTPIWLFPYPIVVPSMPSECPL